jgi:hypothetical protein
MPEALSAEKVSPPATATETVLEVVEPVPSWPKTLLPQQYAAPAVVTPHVCSLVKRVALPMCWPRGATPRASVEKVSPPATATGTELELVEPSPSWPELFNPQQYAAPVLASPHVCSPEALSAENVTPPVTATGTELELVEPSPSWPALFDPQQYATPLVARPHVCSPEALRAENVIPPATATGTVLEVVEPSPSRPEPFDPQQ